MDTDALKVVADGAAGLVTWALALGGSSIVAMISTSYLQPGREWRRIYLLFFPGWLLIGASVYYGHQISRRYMAAVLGLPANVPTTASAINDDFARQLCFLELGIAFFALWLTLFLFWWVFVHPREHKSK